MAGKNPVVVYAASGYTGRLACEWLTKFGIAFVAAGRNQARLDEVAAEMRAKGADCTAEACEHTPDGLRKLFRGAKVVINISGPFSLLGRAVVEAALAEGCHYVDSTGEQDFMLDMRRDFGPAFARANLLLSPSSAFLWGPGTAAAEACLETPDIDSLEVVYAPPSLQTVASLQSMIRTVRRDGYRLTGGALTLLPDPEGRKVEVPGQGKTGAMVVGAGEATFFMDDPRVKNCDTLFANNQLYFAGPFFRTWRRLAKVVSGDTLDRWSDKLVLLIKRDPPAEEPESGRFVVTVRATGPGKEIRVTLNGTSPYIMTGFLCAMAAESLLAGRAKVFGYASLARAFGARYALQRMEEVGTMATFELQPQTQALP